VHVSGACTNGVTCEHALGGWVQARFQLDCEIQKHSGVVDTFYYTPQMCTANNYCITHMSMQIVAFRSTASAGCTQYITRVTVPMHQWKTRGCHAVMACSRGDQNCVGWHQIPQM